MKIGRTGQMDFIKEHKFMVITGSIFLLLIIASIVLGYQLFFSYDNNKYGNRLNNIENLKINEHTITKLESELKEFEEIESVKVTITGKLINVIFHVDNALEKERAKEYGDKVLTYFSEEERKNYDIQIYCMTKELTEKTGYSMIGYVKAGKDTIRWSNN